MTRKGRTMPDEEGRKNGSAGASSDSGPSLDRIGGLSGALVGAGIGSAAGPVGSIIGGIAGAIGGWWAGHAVIEAAHSLNPEDDAHFREHYDSLARGPADIADDGGGGAFYLGQTGSHNPDFASREFADMESDLQQA